MNKLAYSYLIKESFNTHVPNNPAKIVRNNPPKSSLENGGLYAYCILKLILTLAHYPIITLKNMSLLWGSKIFLNFFINISLLRSYLNTICRFTNYAHLQIHYHILSLTNYQIKNIGSLKNNHSFNKVKALSKRSSVLAKQNRIIFGS